MNEDYKSMSEEDYLFKLTNNGKANESETDYEIRKMLNSHLTEPLIKRTAQLIKQAALDYLAKNN